MTEADATVRAHIDSDPVIFDCDGVLGSFIAHVVSSTGAKLNHEDVTTYDLFTLLTEEQRTIALRCCDDADWWRDMPCYEGARDAVDRVRAYGAHVIFATQPWSTCRHWKDAREAWLIAHFGAHADDVVCWPHKHLIRGCTIVEDRPAHAARWAARNPQLRAALIDRPYNRSAQLAPNIIRIASWNAGGADALLRAVFGG